MTTAAIITGIALMNLWLLRQGLREDNTRLAIAAAMAFGWCAALAVATFVEAL